MAWSATVQKVFVQGLRAVSITYADDTGTLPDQQEQFPINATTTQNYLESRVANKIIELEGQDVAWATIVPGVVNPKAPDTAAAQFQQDLQKLQYLQVLVNSGAMLDTDKTFADLQAKVKAEFDPAIIGLEAVAVKP